MNYIKNEIIAKQVVRVQGQLPCETYYCKYSRPLNAIAIVDLTKDTYTKYWLNQYKNNTEDEMEQIRLCCEEKFENGLLPTEDMINLIIKSKDFPKEKERVLTRLGYKPVKGNV